MLRQVRFALAAAAVLSLTACEPTTTGTLPSGDFLVTAPSTAPTFPLTVDYLPPGVDRTVEEINGAPQNQITYGNVDISGVKVATRSSSFDADVNFWDAKRPATAVTVGGRPGKLQHSNYSPGDSAVLTWQRKPGQWVAVKAYRVTGTQAALQRVAGGLRDQVYTGKPRFKVARAPAGSVVLNFDYDSLELGLPGDQASSVYLSVTSPYSDNDIGDDTHDAQEVKVGSLSGWLQKKDGILRMTLRVSDSIWMSIHADDADPWNEDRLRRFAEGVEYVGPQPG